MEDFELIPKEAKTIRFESSLINRIDELRRGTERNFSRQVIFMLKKYLEILDTK